ncbi:MAG: PDZ domain-containing protein [Terracidiphilus sp.]|nr:PDZ domain-containing protein [Terracidiphilus sp.]
MRLPWLRQQAAEQARQNAAAESSAAPASGVRFGFQLRAVTDADVATYGLAKAQGIVVVDVAKDSLAEKMGIQPGDVILEVNNSEIGDLDLFTQYLHGGSVKKFHIWRKGQGLDVAVPQSL